MTAVHRAGSTDWGRAAALLAEYVGWLRAEARIDPFVEQPGFADELRRLAEYYSGGVRALLLAAEAGNAVGTIAVWCHADGTAELKRMYVRREQRGAGVADALIDAALRFAAGQGCREVWLESVAGAMDAAIAVYRRHGFRVTERRSPTLSVRGLVVMSRRLEPDRRCA